MTVHKSNLCCGWLGLTNSCKIHNTTEPGASVLSRTRLYSGWDCEATIVDWMFQRNFWYILSLVLQDIMTWVINALQCLATKRFEVETQQLQNQPREALNFLGSMWCCLCLVCTQIWADPGYFTQHWEWHPKIKLYNRLGLISKAR